MKKKKLLKVLSGVCVVTMSLGMLSGCGGNSTDSDGQTGKQRPEKSVQWYNSHGIIKDFRKW